MSQLLAQLTLHRQGSLTDASRNGLESRGLLGSQLDRKFTCSALRSTDFGWEDGTHLESRRAYPCLSHVEILYMALQDFTSLFSVSALENSSTSTKKHTFFPKKTVSNAKNSSPTLKNLHQKQTIKAHQCEFPSKFP